MSDRLTPEWLTVRDVARLLSVSPRQVWKWIGGKDFELKRFGLRSVRISRRSVDAFIARTPEP